MSDDASRMLNLGEELDLGARGKILVREFSLEDITKFGPSIANLIGSASEEKDSNAAFLSLLKNSTTLQTIKECVAAVTTKTPDFFDNLPVVDWLRVFMKIKSVNRWEEMKELFLQLKNSMNSSE